MIGFGLDNLSTKWNHSWLSLAASFRELYSLHTSGIASHWLPVCCLFFRIVNTVKEVTPYYVFVFFFHKSQTSQTCTLSKNSRFPFSATDWSESLCWISWYLEGTQPLKCHVSLKFSLQSISYSSCVEMSWFDPRQKP